MALHRFQEFIQEALVPSQYRKYVKEFQRERYADIFKAAKEKYEGDKNAYRIYLPVVRTQNKVEKEIATFLTSVDYELINYTDGTCKFQGAKNITKIGKVLTKFKQDKLMKKFVEDPQRKSGSELLVCVSRHPYDIAGADTDRDWTNCMTLKVDDHHPRAAKLIEQINQATTKEREIREQIVALMQKHGVNSRGGVNRQVDELTKQNKEDGQLLRKLFDEFEKNTQKRREAEHDLSNRRDNGCNIHYIMGEIKAGSLISYLIRANDKNIQKPIAVLNIKPFINKTDKEDILLVADKNMYGEGVPEFKTTVNNWLEEVNVDKNGIYDKAPGSYDDSGWGRLTKINTETMHTVTQELITEFKTGEPSKANLQRFESLDSVHQKEVVLGFGKTPLDKLGRVWNLINRFAEDHAEDFSKGMIHGKRGVERLKIMLFFHSASHILEVQPNREEIVKSLSKIDLYDPLYKDRNDGPTQLYYYLIATKGISSEETITFLKRLKAQEVPRGYNTSYCFEALLAEAIRREIIDLDAAFGLGLDKENLLELLLSSINSMNATQILKIIPHLPGEIRIVKSNNRPYLVSFFAPPIQINTELGATIEKELPAIIHTGKIPKGGHGLYRANNFQEDDDDCEECNGDGTIDCPECDGNGTVSCEECDGDGGRECEECQGEGKIRCQTCDGEGKIECKECEGSGTCQECQGEGTLEKDGEDIDCPHCNGSGNCPACDGEGGKECADCEGEGNIECTHCDGEGRFDCPNCDGNGRVDCQECDGSGHRDCPDCDGTGHQKEE